MISYGRTIRWRGDGGTHEVTVNSYDNPDQALRDALAAAQRMGYRRPKWWQVVRRLTEVDYDPPPPRPKLRELIKSFWHAKKYLIAWVATTATAFNLGAIAGKDTQTFRFWLWFVVAWAVAHALRPWASKAHPRKAKPPQPSEDCGG
jgi:hypothetical protein